MSGRFSNNCVEMFQGWPSIRFRQTMLIGRKTWPPEGGAVLPYMALVKTEKKSSPTKVSGRFSNNFVEMFLGWPSIRFLQAMLIGQKTWPPGGGTVWRVNFCLMAGERYWPSWASCLVRHKGSIPSTVIPRVIPRTLKVLVIAPLFCVPCLWEM